MSIILGCDPGQSGAISAFDENTGVLIDVIDMPVRLMKEPVTRKRQSKYLSDGKTLRKKKAPPKKDNRKVFDDEMLHQWIDTLPDKPKFAYIESVASMPGQGVASTFKFGDMFGCIKGFMGGAKIPFSLVSPREWQISFDLYGVTKDKKQHKVLISEKCIEMYPTADIYGSRGGLKDGRSDAILIGHFGINS